MVTIIESGQQRKVDPVEAMAMEISKLIYICPDCDPLREIAHLAPDRTWTDVNEFLATVRA